MNTFNEVLKELMDKFDMSDSHLAELVGVNRSTVVRWRNGIRSPKLEKIPEIASVFEVDPKVFIGKKTNNLGILTIYNQLEQPRQKKVYDYAEHQLKEQKAQSVNVYGQTAAGEALEYDQSAIEEGIVSYVPKGTDGALVVRGDSMEPVLNNNELLFFKKTPQVENGDIAVVEIEGNAVTTKKVRYDFENEKIILQSINKKYDDMVFDNEDIRIIGKVLL